MIRTKGEAGTGDVVQAVTHARQILNDIKKIQRLVDEELMTEAKNLRAPYELVCEIKNTENSMTRKPNIIMVLADDLGWSELESYGNTFNETPYLNRLANEGMRFTHAYASAPVCSPYRACFMTGQYPSDTGARCNEDILGSDIPTFAHALSLAGYETALCGRMHFTGPDQRHGFEKRLVGDLTGVHHRLLRPEADQLMRDAVEAMNQSWHAANFSGPVLHPRLRRRGHRRRS